MPNFLKMQINHRSRLNSVKNRRPLSAIKTTKNQRKTYLKTPNAFKYF